jgi:Ca-activated chloride channel family protein
MAALVNQLWQVIPKPLLFGLYAAGGCLIGAILGEILLAGTRMPSSPQAVALLIDCSGSMYGPKLHEVKEAALRFVRRQDLSKVNIAVVGFGSQAHVTAGLSTRQPALEQGIRGLADGGGTRMDVGLQVATQQLSQTSAQRHILLFTDGMPDSQESTVRAAQSARDLGIRIVAVATDDADTAFLARLTGNPLLVFRTATGRFEEAFRRAEEAIFVVVESSPTGGQHGLVYALLRIGSWTALLALGIGLALIISQNHYLQRHVLTFRQGAAAVPGSVAAGLMAGAAGQLLFAGTAGAFALQVSGRVVAWTILGALVGRGMALFVPNLNPRRALIGGSLGGAVGGIGFLWAAGALGDVAGRLAGAAILGFLIGLMVAVVEATFREAWLEINYGRKEIRTVSLGPEPVSIGSDPNACTIYTPSAPPVAVRYKLERGRVVCEDVLSGHTITVPPGAHKAVGNLTVGVCVAANAARPAPWEPVSPDRSSSFSIRLSTGRIIELNDGVRLSAADIPGLQADPSGGAVAEVNHNPNDPTILGLKNLSCGSWSATIAAGERKQIEPGRSIRLANSTKINFGSVIGEIYR